MRTVTSSEGLVITIGENAAENDAICKNARQNDRWLHLENGPSPHVIISLADGKAVSDVSINHSIHEAAQMLKHFSSQR